MRRILIAELKQETATFNPWCTRYEDFRIAWGADILGEYRDTKTELAGAIEVFEARDSVEIVPTMAAAAVSGGPIRTQDLDRLLDEFVDSASRQPNIDGAYLCFHGAMAGEEEGDPEGRVLREIRKQLGDVPIVVSLDLHAVITDRLVDATDIMVPFHTYPHVDQYETGQRAARNLLRLLEGSLQPTTARVQLPMLVRGDELITTSGRLGEAIQMCQQIESSAKGLAAGVIIGNPFTDVPDLRSNVLVTTNNDRELAEQRAAEIAGFMWRNRDLFQAQLTSLNDAVRLAIETEGLTVFSDAADATASGASGDSNAILKRLLESNFPKTALVPIVDAPAVEKSFGAGVGATLQLTLGGTRDPGRFEPLSVRAYVKSLHDGQFRYEDGTVGYAGRVAVLSIGHATVMVTERPVYVVGCRVFQAHGLEPTDFDLVVVKSPNGFRTWYQSIAARIVPVDVPGSTSANLKSLPFENCVRPIWPLDEEAQPLNPFTPSFN